MRENLTELVEQCSGNSTLFVMLHLDDRLPYDDILRLRSDAYSQLETQLAQLDRIRFDQSINQLIPPEVEAILNSIANESVRPIPRQIINSVLSVN